MTEIGEDFKEEFCVKIENTDCVNLEPVSDPVWFDAQVRFVTSAARLANIADHF